jgi:hypothetical protein
MPTPDQKKKLLKAKIAVALHDELGRVPKKEEIEQVFLRKSCKSFLIPRSLRLTALTRW